MIYTVYAKSNDAGYLTAVNSSAFLPDTTGWTKIDEGQGDRYMHAQGNYLPEPIYTDSGVYRYKLVNGAVEECTAEEIAEQEAALPEPYDELADMREALNMLGVNANG